MPVMTGIEATTRWREVEAERFAAASGISSAAVPEAHVHIIAVTAHATAEDRKEWCGARSGVCWRCGSVLALHALSSCMTRPMLNSQSVSLRSRSLACGMDDFLSKPVDVAVRRHRAAALQPLSQQAPRPPWSSKSRAAVTRPPRSLANLASADTPQGPSQDAAVAARLRGGLGFTAEGLAPFAGQLRLNFLL